MKKQITALLATFFLLSSCKYFGHGEATLPNAPEVLGFTYSQSKKSFEETYGILQNTIESNPNITIVAEVNHSANATSVDLMLNPTRIILFGNPKLGTPLMQKSQLAGLDLPQKILVYQNDGHEVYLGFNNTDYLSYRHGLNGVGTLPMIETVLMQLTTNASHDAIIAAESNRVDVGEGIVTKIANQSFDESYNSLRNAIATNPNLRIVAEVNHQANASSVGMDLNPTRLIIFGNPKLGSPLMQNAQTTALDLPQKILIWEDADSIVHVSYNNPDYLVKRHGIMGNEDILNTIGTALENLSNVAIGN